MFPADDLKPAMRRPRRRAAPPRRRAGILATLVALVAGSGAVAGVQATASATADGPFAQQEVQVNPGNGFGGGTIHYPVGAQGQLPAVVIGPALDAGRGYYEWNGAKLATYGFIALVIDTNDPGDMFTQRRDEMLAAADYLVNASAIRDRVDGGRIAIEGHSASAVGALLAGVQRPSLKAVIALAPVGAGIGPQDVTGLRTPALLVCGTADSWAPQSQCQALADAMPGDVPKRVVAVPGAQHGFPTGDDDVAFPSELQWLQEHLAG